MLPHLYAGAGQGIEDGWLLAQLLSHPETSLQNMEVNIILHVFKDQTVVAKSLREEHDSTLHILQGQLRAMEACNASDDQKISHEITRLSKLTTSMRTWPQRVQGRLFRSEFLKLKRSLQKRIRFTTK